MDKEDIERLEEIIGNLDEELLMIKYKINDSATIEYKELLRTILSSIDTELENKESELSKEEILKNLKEFIKDFLKSYKIFL